MPGTEIRRATVDDATDLGRVHATSRGAAYAGLVPAEALARVTPRVQADIWRERLTGTPAPQAAFVATVDGEVVGFAFGQAEGEQARLQAIHVVPAALGTGTGQALMEAMVETFVGWGCRTARLTVVEGNERAQAFYRRNGWTREGGVGEPRGRRRRGADAALPHVDAQRC